MTPKSKAIDQIQKQLEASHAQLKELASQHMPPPPPPLPAAEENRTEKHRVLQGQLMQYGYKPVLCGIQ